MKLAVLLIGLSIALQAGTYTAATCSRADVDAVINGPTHTAVNGDVIQIPSGSCSWTSGITVPDGIGITINGVGTPDSDASTFGVSASCSQTVITVSNGATAFTATPDYGAATTRISCMQLAASVSALGVKILGTCTASGCPNMRIDNINFTGWATGITQPLGNSAGITAIGDVFGTLDHNTITGSGGYLVLTQFSHASYMGVGLYGDNSWAQPEDYGTNKFLYYENNIFNNSGCCETESTVLGTGKFGGGRVVVRFNQANVSDTINFLMGWHGTESGGRVRGPRAFEFYGNTFTCATGISCGQVAGGRSATGLAWGNTTDKTGAGLNEFYTLSTMRTQANIGGWGACDGSSPWDANDGVVYYSGTVQSGGGTTTITVSPDPGWSVNQWAPAGAPYSMHDVTKNTGSEISSNTSNTLTVRRTGVPAAWFPDNGDSFQILRATACLDQAGGRGEGVLYNSTNPATPEVAANQVLSPTYFWSNTFIGGSPNFGTTVSGVTSMTARVIRGRDFYSETTNQAAQTSSTSPFDGTSTTGIGHGTLANRPTSCTTGVGYWATDQGNWNLSENSFGQGQFYKCTSTNTWTLSYTPYTYPHPLLTGESGGSAFSYQHTGSRITGGRQ